MTSRKGKLLLVCSVCKREYRVRASDPALYTEEVKKNWVCLNCPRGPKVKTELKTEGKMSPKRASVASQTSDTRVVTKEELQEILSKLKVPQVWKTSVTEKFDQGVTTARGIEVVFEALVEEKARVKAGGNLEARKQETKKVITRVIASVAK